MGTDRRTFLGGSIAVTTTGVVGSALAADQLDADIERELEARKRFLSPPDGTPSDLEARPSPPVTPFVDDVHVPIIATPIIDMSSAAYRDLPNDTWWRQLELKFAEVAALFRAQGIDIGGLPVPDSHQRFYEFRPQKFYLFRERELPWIYHSDYRIAGADDSLSWGFETLSLNEGVVEKTFSSPGPTFHAYYGEPILVRRINALPEIGNNKGSAKLRFALPSTTTHLHNAHTASESDGFPNDWINPGEYWDHHYGNFASGHDEREKLATLWYHDHRMDFTASNVYAGLDGFYFLFDEKDDNGKAHGLVADDPSLEQDVDSDEFIEDPPAFLAKQTNGRREQLQKVWDSWRLPSGDYDIPLILHDLLFEKTGYGPPELAFDGFNTDGILGDRFTINRKVQPRMKVEPRKYRFRLLNGGPSRFYELFLHSEAKAGTNYDETKFFPAALSVEERKERTKHVSELDHPFMIITGDGNFQPNTVLADSVYLGVAQRVDVVIDFSEFESGDHVYLVNQLEQTNGRGPTERKLDPDDHETLSDFFEATGLLRFEVVESQSADNSFVPFKFRDFPPVDLTEAKRERVWEFDYDGGLWTINGRVFDPNRIDAGIEQDSAEIWTFRNTGNTWHHPIHSHFTEFIVLEINGEPQFPAYPQTGELARVTDQPYPAFVAGKELSKKVMKRYKQLMEKNPKNPLPESMVKDVGRLPVQVQQMIEQLPSSVTAKIRAEKFDEILIGSYADFRDWAEVFPTLNLGNVKIGRFMGGSRRDVALILPNWEVKVFMRWKDFLGKHVMHCHNVVHEDHAMMIRWEIVPKGQGFDTPKDVDHIALIGENVERDRKPHIETHPRTATPAENDGNEP